MPIAIGIVALVAVVGIVLLTRYIAKAGDKHTAWRVVLLMIGFAVAMTAAQIASLYYRIPVIWIVGLAAMAAAVAAVFIRVGRDVKWAAPRVAAVVGVVVLAIVLVTAAMMVAPLGKLFLPLYETRAQQMAAAAGFKVLLPSDQEIVTDYLPIESIGKPIEGVAISYRRFNLAERAASSGEGLSELRGLVAPMQDPMRMQAKIPQRATVEDLTVSGEPAVGVAYAMDPGKAAASSTVHILVFAKDGVEVRMFSDSHMEYLGAPERYRQVDALSFAEMVKIAESMKPLE